MHVRMLMFTFSISQQRGMRSEEQRKQVKGITMQALSRFEKLKLEPTGPSAPPKQSSSSSGVKSDIDLLSELDQLPPPPSDSPKGTAKGTNRSATMPRGTYVQMLLKVATKETAEQNLHHTFLCLP